MAERLCDVHVVVACLVGDSEKEVGDVQEAEELDVEGAEFGDVGCVEEP